MYIFFPCLLREQVLDSFSKQRQRFEISTGREKALACMDLVLLSLYIDIPPSRAQEIRTLKLFEEGPDRVFTLRDFSTQNVLVVGATGEHVIHLNSYKTAKFRGHDQIPIDVSCCCCCCCFFFSFCFCLCFSASQKKYQLNLVEAV